MAKIIGEKQMKEFQLSLPDGFNSTIPKKVVPMDNLGKRKLLRKKKTAQGKRKASTENVKNYNTELIYSRFMCLLSIYKISFEDLFMYELSTVPVSLFLTVEKVATPITNLH